MSVGCPCAEPGTMSSGPRHPPEELDQPGLLLSMFPASTLSLFASRSPQAQRTFLEADCRAGNGSCPPAASREGSSTGIRSAFLARVPGSQACRSWGQNTRGIRGRTLPEYAARHHQRSPDSARRAGARCLLICRLTSCSWSCLWLTKA